MLDKEDIEKIVESVNRVNDIFKKEDIEIKTINLDDFEKTDERITYIDSSYVSGIVGPLSYIYSRAVAVSEDREIRMKDFVIIPDILIEVVEENKRKNIEISSIASLVSKNLEYRLLDSIKEGYVIFDGSLVSDYVLFGKFERSVIEEINKRIFEFRGRFLSLNRYKVLSVAKRILHSKLFNSMRPDFVVLLDKYPFEPFCTEVIKKEVLDIKIKALYIRSRAYDHIYRVEAFDNISDNDFLSVVKTIFDGVSYPVGLKLAHNLSKIKEKEKRMIEDIIKNIIGVEKSIGWETK